MIQLINNYKINKIVKYIRQSEFKFEVEEVVQDIKGILADYGILDLSDDEYLFLQTELLPLAEQFEISEVLYLTSRQEDLLTV